jgi:hypothetical protein
MKVSVNKIDELDTLTGENDHLRIIVAPAAGGRILSIYNKKLDKEFLWKNKNLLLRCNEPGADYDSNFWGGIDELIPNDIMETIDGVQCPDHGELWTTKLDFEVNDGKMILSGKLAQFGLGYKKTVSMNPDEPVMRLEYQIINESGRDRHFLWKLHAAMAIENGDRLMTSARRARIVDPEYSRFTSKEEFKWPIIENTNASLVPEKNETMDFFYLYDINVGEMNFISADEQSLFSYRYDQKIFPYQWYFASYGKFLDHFTAILEPCSSMPISVNEAKPLGQCSRLSPGQELKTVVEIYAGRMINLIGR